MAFEAAAPGSVVVKRGCRKKEGAADVSISQQGQEWKRHEAGKAERGTGLGRGSADVRLNTPGVLFER